MSPTVATVPGVYSASTLAVSTPTGTTDQLARGAPVSVTLAVGGSTVGRRFLPGGAGNGGDLIADLAGTWMLKGGVVTFAQSADTFIRDVAFTASRNRLSGEGTFDSGTIRLVLTKGG